jgi:LemA protein
LKGFEVMGFTTILLIALGILAVMAVVLYNRLVALRQTRNNAFSDIDVQLQQRFDLVPNLVKTVKGYASHEKDVFESVTNARAGVSKAETQGERLKAEGALGGALMNLFAVAENYPDLKADTNFLRLQDELSDLENKISAARRFFNNATNELNTSIEQFPSNILAKQFGFNMEEFFELDEKQEEAIRKAPDVSFGE